MASKAPSFKDLLSNAFKDIASKAPANTNGGGGKPQNNVVSKPSTEVPGTGFKANTLEDSFNKRVLAKDKELTDARVKAAEEDQAAAEKESKSKANATEKKNRKDTASSNIGADRDITMSKIGGANDWYDEYMKYDPDVEKDLVAAKDLVNDYTSDEWRQFDERYNRRGIELNSKHEPISDDYWNSSFGDAYSAEYAKKYGLDSKTSREKMIPEPTPFLRKLGPNGPETWPEKEKAFSFLPNGGIDIDAKPGETVDEEGNVIPIDSSGDLTSEELVSEYGPDEVEPLPIDISVTDRVYDEWLSEIGGFDALAAMSDRELLTAIQDLANPDLYDESNLYRNYYVGDRDFEEVLGELSAWRDGFADLTWQDVYDNPTNYGFDVGSSALLADYIYGNDIEGQARAAFAADILGRIEQGDTSIDWEEALWALSPIIDAGMQANYETQGGLADMDTWLNALTKDTKERYGLSIQDEQVMPVGLDRIYDSFNYLNDTHGTNYNKNDAMGAMLQYLYDDPNREGIDPQTKAFLEQWDPEDYERFMNETIRNDDSLYKKKATTKGGLQNSKPGVLTSLMRSLPSKKDADAFMAANPDKKYTRDFEEDMAQVYDSGDIYKNTAWTGGTR